MFIWTYFDKAQAYWQSSHLEWWWRESRKREMWRFLTYSLLHSSWWHLTFNLVVQVIHQTFKLSNLFKQTFKLTYFHFPNVTLWCDVSDLPLNFYFSTLTYIVVVDPCDSSFHVVKLWNCQLSNWSDFHSSIRTFNLVVIMIQLSFFPFFVWNWLWNSSTLTVLCQWWGILWPPGRTRGAIGDGPRQWEGRHHLHIGGILLILSNL